ncbi:MAG: OsmC family protein [Deltaproteobacteria bacterium]|jgi:putative redox protein|nr:OsmC family protein [Deltaproteobacteria bacterium]MBW2533215.1 OsmC family protein [Deltaproteobacteria bacterium]
MGSARVKWVQGRQFVGETESGHGLVLDTPEEVGGSGTGPSPMELILLGQAGCTGIDVVFILERMKKTVTAVEVAVEGTRAETEPKVYTALDVHYRVRGRGLAEKDVRRAIELSETKYCSVSIMLAKTATIRSRYEISDEETGERYVGVIEH